MVAGHHLAGLRPVHGLPAIILLRVLHAGGDRFHPGLTGYIHPWFGVPCARLPPVLVDLDEPDLEGEGGGRGDDVPRALVPVGELGRHHHPPPLPQTLALLDQGVRHRVIVIDKF